MKFFRFKIVIYAIIIMVLFSMVALPVKAQLSSGNLGIDYAENLGLGNKDPRDMTVSIIQVAFGFLAILAVLIIIIGIGMAGLAGEDKANFARKLMIAGIIGLIIILASWGIARFVVTAVLNATQ